MTALLPRLFLTASIVLFFLASWIVLPPLHRLLLPLSVGAPELSPWLLAGAIVLGGASLATTDGHRTTVVILALAAGAALLSAVPLAQLPGTIGRFDEEMRANGADVRAPSAHPADAAPRRAPMVSRELLFGIETGETRIVRSIPFAAPGGVVLTLDVYRPTAPGVHPTVVQIYGGAWQRGAPGQNATAAAALAAQGFVVFAIDYRHAPQWPWPAQIEDVRAALAWIHAHGAAYQADVSRLALLGRSAGAQLAMVAAYEPSAPPIAAVVSLYGAVDLVEGYRDPPSPDPLDVRAIERAYLGGTPDEKPDRYRAASPVSYAVRPLPPTLLIYGARDHVVLPRLGLGMAARLRAAGGTAVSLEIPWAGHGFDAVPNGLSGQLSRYYTERFLAWAFARAGSRSPS